MPSLARKITQFERKEITHLFANAKRTVKSPAFDLLKSPTLKEFGRILIITSRKVGNAPERNQVRRRLKALFYEYEYYKKPYDWAIIIKKAAIALSFDVLKKLFLEGLERS
jgi:ribonuclease P protein component